MPLISIESGELINIHAADYSVKEINIPVVE
jgi:hypothetical protein